MSATTHYQIRLDEQEKAETFAVFKELGIRPADAVRQFFGFVRKTSALPFASEYTPNAKTTKALLLSDAEKDYKNFDSVEALLQDLNDA